MASTSFIIHIKRPNDEDQVWNSGFDMLKFDGNGLASFPLNEKPGCDLDENAFRAYLVLGVSMSELDPKQRVQMIHKFADFISESPSGITMTSKQSEAVAKLLGYHVAAAGPGDSDDTSQDGVEVGWFLGCGVKFSQLQDFIQVMEHNVNTGRIREEIGLNVVGWQVRACRVPEPIKKLRRQKRQVMQTALQTPAVLAYTPSIFVHPSSSIENSVFGASVDTLKVLPSVSERSSFSESTVPYSHRTSYATASSLVSTMFFEAELLSYLVDTSTNSMFEDPMSSKREEMSKSTELLSASMSEVQPVSVSGIRREKEFSSTEFLLSSQQELNREESQM